MRRPLIIANWKMNGTRPQAAALVDEIVRALAAAPVGPEVTLAPPFTLLSLVAGLAEGSGITLAAQNLHPATHGAFTGEVSGPMLAELGVRYVIVGHSERRRLCRETDEEIGRKAAAACSAGLIPVLCVGEEESERMSGRTFEVIERQLTAGIARLPAVTGASLVIAYEPVWAIGTGRTASAEQAEEAHRALRESLARLAGDGQARAIRIIYGGSATPDTVSRIFLPPDVDGALVGGASLNAVAFASIIAAVPPSKLSGP